MKLEGIHHITAITADAQDNVDFYAGVLGLRLVKKTVNQDQPTVYHLFFADEKGSAGSDLTFFEFPGVPAGRAGAGDVHRIVWRVGSVEAPGFWEKRLAANGVERQALNTDDWVKTSDKLIQNPTVRSALPTTWSTSSTRTSTSKRNSKASCPAKPSSSPARSPAWLRSGRAGRRRKAAGNVDRAEPLGGRQPERPRTARRGARRQEGSGLHRKRRSEAPARQPGHQPRQPDRDRRRPSPKSCRRTPPR